jgi:hypothetical protein
MNTRGHPGPSQGDTLLAQLDDQSCNRCTFDSIKNGQKARTVIPTYPVTSLATDMNAEYELPQVIHGMRRYESQSIVYGEFTFFPT